ncbi:MAG: type II toxin-antitoxin system VapC family toxin [Capsulimonadaceae bacterium]
MPTSLPASVLFDTNILVRAISPGDTRRPGTLRAIRRLKNAGVKLHICTQNMQEFRQVATRPATSNGLGMTSADVAASITDFEREYSLIVENLAGYQAWRLIVETVQTVGRSNFDARIVATAMTSGIEAVLTYESASFVRYGAVANVAILDPVSV